MYVPGALLPIIEAQADRCMDCGVPFCHEACPLGNLIPEWNELVSRDDWRAASDRLHATNNFPEFTGRLCPAPCEAGCVLAINQPAVTIKNVEVAIADRAWQDGLAPPKPPDRLSGATVAVVGSGPAGLAAAQQLTRAGHTVAVFERDDRPGGLMRYGIPAFKMEKRHLDRRLAQLRDEGVRFRTSTEVGRDIGAAELRSRYDAVVLAVGATAWRELDVPGRELAGIVQAMEYLPLANRVRGRHRSLPVGRGQARRDRRRRRHRRRLPGHGGARGRRVRHAAGHLRAAGRRARRAGRALADVSEDLPAVRRPRGGRRAADRARGGRRRAPVRGIHAAFRGGRVGPGEGAASRRGRRGAATLEGTSRELPADLVLLALGFSGPERGAGGPVGQLGLAVEDRGTLARDARFTTSVPGVFAAGDAARGQSLIVWAIAEGRSAAAAVDHWLTGSTRLPAPIGPYDRPMMA